MGRKRWGITALAVFVLLLAAAAGATALVDPFYHYHAPLEGLSYAAGSWSDVYQNDGVVKHFDYDAVVAGTSMTLNFKTAEVDELFGVSSVKTSFLGEGFLVINRTLQTAVDANPDLKLVIRGVDDTWFVAGADWKGREEYPEYLYDDNLCNDVYYLLNGSVLRGWTLPILADNLGLRRKKKESAADDGSFDTENETGREQVLEAYERPPKEIKEIDPAETEEFFRILEENLQQNVLQIMQENPDITFYLFLPPYSICWWDSLNQNGTGVLERRIDLEQYAIEKMLDCENVRLFSFFNNFDLICNLDNYVDSTHYRGEVNSQILRWMKDGEYELTKENYKDYIREIKDFYTHYDYDAIFDGGTDE